MFSYGYFNHFGCLHHRLHQRVLRDVRLLFYPHSIREGLFSLLQVGCPPPTQLPLSLLQSAFEGQDAQHQPPHIEPALDFINFAALDEFE